MANSTENLDLLPVGKEGRHIHVGVDGASHIRRGIMVTQLTATGMLVPATTAAAGPVIGVATHEQDNTAGADGDLEVKVEYDRIFRFSNATAGDACSAATPLGAAVYAKDDHTIADNSNAGAYTFAGFFRGLDPDGTVKVYIPLGSQVTNQAADIGALTDNTGGAANDTLEAVPSPADAPGTADILRDDLVANAFPAIRNNFADLADAINDMRAALQAAGLMS